MPFLEIEQPGFRARIPRPMYIPEEAGYESAEGVPFVGWFQSDEPATLSVDLGDGWVVDYILNVQDETFIVTRAEIHATVGEVPAGGLLTAVVRQVTVPSHLDLLYGYFRALRDEGDWQAQMLIGPQLPASALLSKPIRRRPGCKGREDAELAEWAEAYVNAHRNRGLRAAGSLWTDLAAETGERPQFCQRQVREAVRRGLKTPAPNGKAGGELTERARDLLAQRDGKKAKRRKRKGGG
jgi:hypothetical protein